ncbi:hypothetical protein Tco_0456244 [Tanacetum coccineum]
MILLVYDSWSTGDKAQDSLLLNLNSTTGGHNGTSKVTGGNYCLTEVTAYKALLLPKLSVYAAFILNAIKARLVLLRYMFLLPMKIKEKFVLSIEVSVALSNFNC